MFSIRQRRYARLISVGRHCQPAHQIRRFTADRRAYYFDWMATPHDGLVHDLRTGFADSFVLANLCLLENEMAVLDRTNGFVYRHAFPRKSSEAPLEWTAVEASYVEVRAKAEMLRQRWLAAVRTENILLIRHDNISHEQILDLYDALQHCTRGNPVGLLIAHPHPSQIDIGHPNIHIECGFPMPTGRDDWKGDDSQWDALLTRYWIDDNAIDPSNTL